MFSWSGRHRNGQGVRRLYPYFDETGIGQIGVWVESSRDVKFINSVVPFTQRELVKLVSTDVGLGRTPFELVSLDEFGSRGLPILCMPREPHDIVAVERSCRAVAARHLSRFSIWDSYSHSQVASIATLHHYRDMNLHILPSVLFPTLYSNWSFINFLVYESGLKYDEVVLDMFAGSGVIGFCLAQETKVSSVSFADVNYFSVQSCRMTKGQTTHQKTADIYLSEALDGLPGGAKYDLIVGNPPHADVEMDSTDRLPGADPGWAAHDNFFRKASNFLSPEGRILFIESWTSGGAKPYYDNLAERFPNLRVGQSFELPGHINYVQEVLASS